jgi:hypothetical protein
MDYRTFCFILLALSLTASVGCGGEEEPAASAIEGAYAMIFGAQEKTYSLKPGDAQVTCRPKPGLKEFELKAENLGDGNNSIEFQLRPFTTDKTKWSIEYKVPKVGETPSSFKVEIAGGYRYVFFQSMRIDTMKAFKSHCKIELDSEEEGMLTKYKGVMVCTMLWSDFGTKDYSPGPLNNYIDLMINFECEY